MTHVAGLIKLFGIPEGVLNDGRSLSAISTALSLNSYNVKFVWYYEYSVMGWYMVCVVGYLPHHH